MNERVSIPTKVASSFNPVQTGFLQRKCVSCGQHAIAGGECAECQTKRSPLQRRSVSQAEPSKVPPIVHEVLRSADQPLDGGTRAFMEPRFGHDFSRVRVHTDTKAAESANSVNALAYTVGQHIVFGRGQYAPQTTKGKKLLAHELTHIVQQQHADEHSHVQASLQVSHPHDMAEQEASVAANRVVAGESVQIRQTASSNVLWGWTGSFNMRTRVPQSRDFTIPVSVGVTSTTRWNNPAACPSGSVRYRITLWKQGYKVAGRTFFNTNLGNRTFSAPGTDTKNWTGVTGGGTYHLEIDWPNTNPACRMLGNLQVTCAGTC